MQNHQDNKRSSLLIMMSFCLLLLLSSCGQSTEDQAIDIINQELAAHGANDVECTSLELGDYKQYDEDTEKWKRCPITLSNGKKGTCRVKIKKGEMKVYMFHFTNN
mgnify:CR=1 FL=1